MQVPRVVCVNASGQMFWGAHHEEGSAWHHGVAAAEGMLKL